MLGGEVLSKPAQTSAINVHSWNLLVGAILFYTVLLASGWSEGLDCSITAAVNHRFINVLICMIFAWKCLTLETPSVSVSTLQQSEVKLTSLIQGKCSGWK